MASLSELAALVGGDLYGDSRLEISGVSEIQNGRPGTITFLANKLYKKFLDDTKASAVISGEPGDLEGRNGIAVDNPQLALAKLLDYFQPLEKPDPGIHPSAVVDPAAEIGENVYVGPLAVIESGAKVGDDSFISAQVFIGRNARVGSNTKLNPQVVVYDHCEIGDRVIIHAGTVLGSDGFGFVTDSGKHHKVAQLGRVIVGNDVEMGGNCSIDRGTIGDTTIGDGTKLDNLVHIAHNVKIGKGCLIAGEVGVAGSAKIGNFCVFAGQVGIAPHITLGDGTICAAKTGVTKSLEGGKIYAGMPAREIREQNKRDAILTSVAFLKKRIANLEDEVSQVRTKQDE